MSTALAIAILFGIFQGLAVLYRSSEYKEHSVPHTSNLLDYVFDTKYRI